MIRLLVLVYITVSLRGVMVKVLNSHILLSWFELQSHSDVVHSISFQTFLYRHLELS